MNIVPSITNRRRLPSMALVPATVTAVGLLAGPAEAKPTATCASQNTGINVDHTGPDSTIATMENSCGTLAITSAYTSGNSTGQEYGGWYLSGGVYKLGSLGFRFIDNAPKSQTTALVTGLLNGTSVGVSAYSYSGSGYYNH